MLMFPSNHINSCYNRSLLQSTLGTARVSSRIVVMLVRLENATGWFHLCFFSFLYFLSVSTLALLSYFLHLWYY